MYDAQLNPAATFSAADIYTNGHRRNDLTRTLVADRFRHFTHYLVLWNSTVFIKLQENCVPICLLVNNPVYLLRF